MTAIELAAEERNTTVEEMLDVLVVAHKSTTKIARVLGVSSPAVTWRLHQAGYEFVDGAWKKVRKARR